MKRSIMVSMAMLVLCMFVTMISGSSGAALKKVAASEAIASSSASCKKPSGTPLHVVAVLDESSAANLYLPDVKAGINAGLHQINCNGGLGKTGSPVSVHFCDDNLDPNTANACIQSAISNPSYVASVGNQDSVGDPGTLFSAANMPDIANNPFGPETTGDSVFNSTAGVFLVGGEAALACKLGYRDINQMLIAGPQGASLTTLDNSVLKSYGCPPISKVIPVPTTATDLSAEVTSAAQGADAILLDFDPSQAPSALKTVQQLGIKVPLISNGGTLGASTLSAAGAAANGAYVAWAATPPNVSSQGNKQFLADMKAIGQSSQVDDSSVSAWLSMDLLMTAAKGLTTVNRSTLLAALNKVSGYNAGGLIPTLNFHQAGTQSDVPEALQSDHLSRNRGEREGEVRLEAAALHSPVWFSRLTLCAAV